MNFCDVVGYKPFLSVFKKDRYKSKFGKLIGILTIISIIILASYFILELLNRKEIQIIFNETSSKNRIVNLADSPIVIYLTDGLGNPLDKNYAELRVNYWNWTYAKPNDTYRSYTTDEIKLEDCNLDSHFGKYKSFFSNFDIQNKTCFPRGKVDYSLIGQYGDVTSPHSSINIVANKCLNTTTNSKCPSEKQLEYVLKNSYISFNFIDYEIDHNNFSNPILPVLRTSYLPLNWDLHSRHLMYFKAVYHTTDQGFIFEDKFTQNAYLFSRNSLTVQIRHGSTLYPNASYGTLTLIQESKLELYSRTYLKGQALIAKIGGMIQALLLLGQAFSYVATKNMFLIDIINYLKIDFEEEFVNKIETVNIKTKNNLSLNNLNSNLNFIPMNTLTGTNNLNISANILEKKKEATNLVIDNVEQKFSVYQRFFRFKPS